MHLRGFMATPLLMLAILATACQPQSAPAGRGSGAAPQGQAAPKRIVAAVQDEIPVVYHTLNPASRFRGVEGVQDLLAAGMTQLNREGQNQPVLAEQVPSLENGLWKLAPDGTMEVTWQIKPGARWHDGTPFTSDDLAFTLQVIRDPELPIFGNAAYAAISGIRIPDPRTATVTWSQPYIHADWLFSAQLGLPFARHLLEQAYQERKASFTDEPYWGQEFIGTGAYRLKDWVLGSHLTVTAFDGFVLGRPKVEEIQVRFISDDETLVANMLAGSVEVILGRSLSGPQAAQLIDAWQGGGRMDLTYSTWIALYPQFIDPNPAVILQLPFRQAVLHGTNRQELVDTLLPGQSSVADSWLLPNQPQYKEIEERNVIRFPYDPRKAMELISGLGYMRGSDGWFADAAGNRLSVEVRTTAGDDAREKMLLAIVDYWKQIGLQGNPVLVPRQQAQDLAYRATFPGFELNRNPPDERGTQNLHSRLIPLPENGFRVTGNRSRYRNAELDTLVDRYFVTIPLQERMQIMGQIVRHFSENLPVTPILYDAIPTMVSNRLVNVGAGGPYGSQAWNAHLWDVKS